MRLALLILVLWLLLRARRSRTLPPDRGPRIVAGLPPLTPGADTIRFVWVHTNDVDPTEDEITHMLAFWHRAQEWFIETTGIVLRWDLAVYVARAPWSEAERPDFSEGVLPWLGWTVRVGRRVPPVGVTDTWAVLDRGQEGARGSAIGQLAFVHNVVVDRVLAGDFEGAPWSPVHVWWHELGHAAWGFDHSPPGSLMVSVLPGRTFDPVAHLPVIAASRYFDRFA